jgi:hypothetical protein
MQLKMNNYDVKEDLYLNLLINSKKISQKESNQPTESYNKLNKIFNKYENSILKNKIILLNFDKFILFFDDTIKNSVDSFCKHITDKLD